MNIVFLKMFAVSLTSARLGQMSGTGGSGARTGSATNLACGSVW